MAMAEKSAGQLIGLQIEQDNRVLRTANAEFSAKQKRFLANIRQSMCIENRDEWSDDSCIYIDDDDDTKDADFELSTSSRNKSKENRKATDKKARDMFCWSCHKTRATGVLCTTCTRVYHYQCAKVQPSNTDEKFRCYECIELDNVKQHDAGQFNSMLQLVLNTVLGQMKSEGKFQNLVRLQEYPKHLMYAIDLKAISKNVNCKKYTSEKAFLLDIAWIAHIHYAYFPMRKEAIQDVQQLYKLCKYELSSIQLCAECFVRSRSRNDYGWFPKACSKPHLLVWAKLSGYPYWPAKVMSVNADEKADKRSLLTVQFFGEHEHAFVPAKDCYLYSREDPNEEAGKKFRQRDFSDCVDEAKQYIDNIAAKFGHFNYAAIKTPVNPKNLAQYVTKMIAGQRTIPHKTISTMRNVTSTSASSLGAWPITSTPQVAPITESLSALRMNGASTVQSQNALRMNAPSTATREAMFTSAKRKKIEDSQAQYYRTKYAKIIENPGTLVLHRVDSPSAPEPESGGGVGSTPPLLNDFVATNARSNTYTDLDAPMALSPFAPSPAIGRNPTMNITSRSILPAVAATSSSTNDIFNPLPSTSAQALPRVQNSLRSTNTADMAHRLNDMIKAANERMISLQNDWRAITNYAAELNAVFDQNKDNHNSQCVNCGKTAKLFCTWSTSYCDYPCRDQHRAIYNDIHESNTMQ